MLCSSKKFEKMAREATDICLRVLKESNKSRFDSYSVKNKCIDDIPYYLSGFSRAQFLRQLSRNSCIRSLAALYQKLIIETLGGSIRRFLHTTKGLL